MKKRSGFTFLEVLIVIVLLGVLFAIALPSIQSRARQSALDAAARHAAQMLRYAQYRAIADGVAVEVRSESAENYYQLLQPSVDERGREKLQAVDGPWGKPVKIQMPVTLEPTSQTVIYYPDGSSSGGELVFRHESLLARVEVKNGLGRLEVQFENQKT